MVLLLRIDSPQRALPRRHRGAAREGVLRRALDGGRDLSLDRLEAGRRHAVRLQVLLVQPDRVALPPLLKQLGGERLKIGKAQALNPSTSPTPMASSSFKKKKKKKSIMYKIIVTMYSMSDNVV